MVPFLPTRARIGAVNRTALIIDDSESVRNEVARALSRSGLFAQIETAGDGLEGMKLLLSQKIDLVLCDLTMPGFDGYKLLSMKESRPELARIPVILLTADGNVKAKVRGLEAGASDYLTKPFHDEELIARVRVHLAIQDLQRELEEKNARLEELARTDELTKAANRRHLMATFEHEFERARRYQLPLSFAMFDADHFKAINDNWGHLAGDRALVAISAALRSNVRTHDLVGRYGGEEFGIVMPHTPDAGAFLAAERCRQAIEKIDALPGHLLTASAGLVSTPPSSATTIEELIHLADEALYRAKEVGLNRCVAAEA